MGILNFLKKSFSDMKESAKSQHEVDKANFDAVKAESRANFEENRGRNTFQKAKAEAKVSWENAKMSPEQRKEKVREEQAKEITDANSRKEAAEKRLEELKK